MKEVVREVGPRPQFEGPSGYSQVVVQLILTVQDVSLHRLLRSVEPKTVNIAEKERSSPRKLFEKIVLQYIQDLIVDYSVVRVVLKGLSVRSSLFSPELITKRRDIVHRVSLYLQWAKSC